MGKHGLNNRRLLVAKQAKSKETGDLGRSPAQEERGNWKMQILQMADLQNVNRN
jgi:hypothetical protein